MPAMNADGTVIDIALNTVKVQNWDMTVTAIPTFKFLDTPFKNWESMTKSGGRRIKRAIMIDQSSIRFADDALKQRLMAVQHLAPFMTMRQKEIDSANAASGADPSSPLNGRRMTNIGLFRHYALEYLQSHRSSYTASPAKPPGPCTRTSSPTSWTTSWPPCPSSACAPTSATPWWTAGLRSSPRTVPGTTRPPLHFNSAWATNIARTITADRINGSLGTRASHSARTEPQKQL
jgi:hypothetical protein